MCLSSSPSILRASSITHAARESDIMRNQSSGKKYAYRPSDRLTTMGEILEERGEEQDESMISSDKTDPLCDRKQKTIGDNNTIQSDMIMNNHGLVPSLNFSDEQ